MRGKSASEFSRQYLTEFENEDTGLSDETFEIRQHMFGEADAYCADPDLRGEWETGEAELMETAVDTADQLEKRLEDLDD